MKNEVKADLDKKDLFTIGEFSKVTGASIHSLRYYDEIGALTPEYVDPLSNYRYYSFSQLSRLFAINICIDSGIRLNDLDDFIKDDSIDYGKLICDSRDAIDSRIEEFLSHKASLSRIEKLIGIRDAILNRSETTVHLDEFTVWAVPHQGTDGFLQGNTDTSLSDQELLIRISSQARKKGVRISPVCFGLIRTGKTAVYEFALLSDSICAGGLNCKAGDAAGTADDPHFITIPAGDYTIRRTSGIGISQESAVKTAEEGEAGSETVSRNEASSNGGPGHGRIIMSCAIACDDPAENIYCTISSI